MLFKSPANQENCQQNVDADNTFFSQMSGPETYEECKVPSAFAQLRKIFRTFASCSIRKYRRLRSSTETRSQAIVLYIL